jgi:hypothetical protein
MCPYLCAIDHDTPGDAAQSLLFLVLGRALFSDCSQASRIASRALSSDAAVTDGTFILETLTAPSPTLRPGWSPEVRLSRVFGLSAGDGQ